MPIQSPEDCRRRGVCVNTPKTMGFFSRNGLWHCIHFSITYFRLQYVSKTLKLILQNMFTECNTVFHCNYYECIYTLSHKSLVMIYLLLSWRSFGGNQL